MGTRRHYIKLDKTLLRIYTLGYVIFLVCQKIEAQDDVGITWHCEDKGVNIKLNTPKPFIGVVYVNNYRSDCFISGSGTTTTDFHITFTSICGQSFDQETERKISIWVRFHPTLELVHDRQVIVSCKKENDIYLTNGKAILYLKLYSVSNEVITNPVEGEKYTLRAELSNSDASHDLSVRECTAFNANDKNNTPLTDQNGCPVDANIMSAFDSEQNNNRADALIYSMFRYPNNTQLFIECIAYACPSKTCPQTNCKSKAIINPPKEAIRLKSSLVVYVQDPGYKSKKNTDCDYNSLLLGLCIAFGVLFLIMLIINIFMCTAMSCTCTKKVLVEEELEDYDPYKMGWVPESTYSNRYGSARGPYSNTSTLESRAPSTSSEQYAVVNSPPSRFSAPSTKDRLGSSISNTYYSSHVNR